MALQKGKFNWKEKLCEEGRKDKSGHHENFKTNTLSFYGCEHMVHLNISYYEIFLHLPVVTKNEEKEQAGTDKVMMLDNIQETNYLNNLQL